MNRLSRRLFSAVFPRHSLIASLCDPALTWLIAVAFITMGIHGGIVVLTMSGEHVLPVNRLLIAGTWMVTFLALLLVWRRLRSASPGAQPEDEQETALEQLRTIVNVLPTGILVLDRDVRVVLANDALRAMLGSNFVEGTLRPEPYPMIHSQTGVEFLPHERPLTQAILTGKPVTQDDIIIQHPTLGDIYVLVQAVPIFDAQGKVVRVAATLQDITELHELERALQDSLGETTLLYEASHSISRTSTVQALIETALWQMNALSPDCALIFLKEDSGEIALAGGTPTPSEQAVTPHDWRPCLQEEAWLFYRTNADGSLARLMDSHELASIVSFPMSVRGITKGWLVVAFRTHTNLPAEQYRFMRTLADQAAITLENQRLLLSTERALQHTAMLYRASRSIADTQDPAEMLMVFARLTPASQTRFAALYLLHADQTSAASPMVRLAATWGQIASSHETTTHYSAAQFPFWEEMQAGELFHVENIDTDLRLSGQARAALTELGAHAATFVPLIAAERTVGMIVIGLALAAPPGKNDLQVYQSLADQAAISLENARLFGLYQQRAAEMAFLFQVTTAATMSPNLDEALKQAVATLREMMGVTNAGIYLPDDSGGYLVRDDGPDSAPPAVESSGNLDRSLIGWVARHGQAVMINDLADDPRDLPGSSTARSAIAVPMRTAGDLIGILVVESDRTNAFTEDHVRLLQTLSGTLAAILQNTRLLREMQQANERLLEVGRLKTNFLAAMSHELRTPLNSIIGFSRVILKGIDGPLTEAQEQDLTAIFDSGKHLLGLVNDILDQAKIEAGKMDISFAYFKMSDIVKGVMSTAVGLTRDKPIHLITEIADDLPLAYGDEFRTRQVLLNLISNAAKFTNEGQITVSAYPVTENERVYIRVDVADTGIGIAEKDMPLLFEAFQQIDNSLTRSVEGTGMGLPLAKSLIELQHGRIEVQSQLGVGSTFSILVPTQPPAEKTPDTETNTASSDATLDSPAASDSPTAHITPDTPPSEGDSPPRVVLVVDDDEESITQYQSFLLGTGYEIIGINRPAEIRQLIETYHPVALLIDVNMSERGGWRILDDLKHDPFDARLPVLLCGTQADILNSAAQGTAALLVKPITQEQLLAAIQQTATAG